MSDQRFELCLPYILKEEGGNDDDPNDHGGRTSRGITQREYDKWRAAKGIPVADVWGASAQEIHDIYYQEYWLPVCPELPPGVDLMYFNIAVNGGTRRATVLLQRALNIPDDSDEFLPRHEHVGPVTLKYAAKANTTWLINDFDQHVVAFYRGLQQFSLYGKGWLAREARIHAASLKMIPQPKETATMPTQTAAPVAHAPMQDPIPQIIAFLETAKGFLPMVSAFLPSPWGAVAKAAIPVVEEVLQLIEDAKTKSGVDLFQTIGQHIQAIGQHVQSTAQVAAAPPQPAIPSNLRADN